MMPPAFKIVVVVLLVCIVGSLGKALFHMSSGPSQSGEMVQALYWRIGLSVLLFVLLMTGTLLHVISPHGVP
jgi:Protein of unknown function (DUF2909)